jgi:hypothetical protein
MKLNCKELNDNAWKILQRTNQYFYMAHKGQEIKDMSIEECQAMRIVLIDLKEKMDDLLNKQTNNSGDCGDSS